MAPKRRAAPKSKNVVEPVAEPEVVVPETSIPVDSPTTPAKGHFTARRAAVDENAVDLHDLSPVSPNNNLNMNATVLIEKIPGYVVKSHESSSSEELSTKSVPKKAYKKKTKKVVASRDNKPEVEEIAVSKSRKRRVESEVEPNEVKQISPTIEKTKRNRRAVNDDVYVSPEESVEPIELKKNSKVNSNSNKEDPSNSLLTGGKRGPFKRPAVMRKKTQNYYSTPEQSDEEEELIPSPEKIVVEMPNIIKEKPKLKKGTKKERDDKPEDIDGKTEQSKPTAKTRAAPKLRQFDDKNKITKNESKPIKSPNKSEESNNSNDSSTKPLESGPKLVRKGGRVKQNNKSPHKSEDSSGKNDSDGAKNGSDHVVTSPVAVKPKRVRKGNTDNDLKEVKEKLTRRGGRKKITVDEDEQLSPPVDTGAIKIGDLPDGLPAAIPESVKNDDKPVVKRKAKPKAKTVKK